MNKINNSEVNKFKGWCCEKELDNNFICGDWFNKRQRFICDDCFLNVAIKKAKIKSLREELLKIIANRKISNRILEHGYLIEENALCNKIKELQDGNC